MEEERKVVILNVDDILPNRFQPRIKFNEKAINELAESIKLHGVIQPIVVRKISDKYEIIAGERRYKASVMAGKTTIPAIVTTLDDRNSAEVALIENVQRQDLTPIEEAISYKKILDMGYINQEELGSKLGKNQSTIANKLRLLNLNDEVQEALMENKISERHARSLLKLNDKDQILMLNRIINERLTVRKTDEEIAKLLENNGSQKGIKEENGEKIMNNDILRDFNIPTEPIMNDTVNNPQPAASPVVEHTINPGFMDVDKIQNTAEDIVKEPEPVANMDELLKPTEIEKPVESVEQPLPVMEETPQPQGGRFFNMFNFNEPEKDDSYVENVEAQQVNMDFGEPKPAQPAFNPFASPAPIQPEPVEKIKIEEPVQPEPISVSFEEPVEEIKVEEPTIEPVVEPIQPESFNTPFQTSTLTDDGFKDLEPIQPFNPEPVVEPVNKSYMMNDDIKFDEDGEIEVQLPRYNEPEKVDMKTIINTIRECANKIEQYGYKIDTDEIDLADTYEVTFKISKND